MQIELGTKKATLHYCILKLCSVLSTPNHATVSNKDQSDFYKGIDGNSIKRIEHIIQFQSQMHYTFSPPTHLCVTRLKHPLLPSTTPQAHSPLITLPTTLSIKPSESYLLDKHVIYRIFFIISSVITCCLQSHSFKGLSTAAATWLGNFKPKKPRKLKSRFWNCVILYVIATLIIYLLVDIYKS